MRKFLLVLLVITAAQFAAFANGTGEAASGPVELSFMWWGDDVRHTATIAAAQAFEDANPGVTVVTQPNPYDGYRDKILIQLAGGTAPDLFCFSTQWIADVAYSDKPVLFNLYDLSDALDLSTFEPTLLKGGEINGKLLGLPTGISGYSYFYNANVMEDFAAKSGLGLPPGPGGSWSFDQFIEYGAAFHETMGEDSYFMVMGSTQLSHWFLSLLSEVAGHFYMNADATIDFTKADLVETLNLFRKMTDSGVYGPPELQVEAMTSSDISSYIAAGLWPVIFDWTSVIPGNEATAGSPMNIMAYPSLGADTNDGIFVRPAQFWSIAAASKHPAEAASLLNFLVNDPAAIKALGLQRSVPPTAEGQSILAEEGALSGPVYEGTAYLMTEASASYHPFILVTEIEESLRNHYAEFILGKVSASTAADEIMTDFDQILSRTRRQYKIQ